MNNHYPYARTYLRALLTLAILVVLVGLAFVFGQLGEIASDVSTYHAVRNDPLIAQAENAPMTIDTEKLVNELKRASVIVGSFTLQYRDTPTAPPLGISGDGFVAELKKRNIGIGEAVELKPSQIDDLKS